jgi:hypothetical protein
VRVEIDGADAELTTLVEAWAHQGPPNVAQKHKVLANALKPIHVASSFEVAVEVVELPADVKAEVLAAQRRQSR